MEYTTVRIDTLRSRMYSLKITHPVVKEQVYFDTGFSAVQSIIPSQTQQLPEKHTACPAVTYKQAHICIKHIPHSRAANDGMHSIFFSQYKQYATELPFSPSGFAGVDFKRKLLKADICQKIDAVSTSIRDTALLRAGNSNFCMFALTTWD